MKHLTWIVGACAALAAAACGQKGPLYLPDHNGSVVTRPAGSTGGAAQPAPQGAPDPSKQQKDQDEQSQPPNPQQQDRALLD